jgi:5'-nucleotidase
VNRPLALLSNDDGYLARGMRALARSLSMECDVVLCAPESEQSATSHAISLNRPLRLVAREPGVFSVDGTPADCVYVALHAEGRVLPRRPDIVVSGMNHGLNLGNDVFYSGTVAAAREGALRGVPAVAFSANEHADMAAACDVAARLVAKLLATRPLPRGLLLNVNFPPGQGGWSLRPTRLGNRTYGDGVVFRKDPRGGEYLWIGTGDVSHDGDDDTDTSAYDHGQVGVTPLSLELWRSEHQQLVASLIDAVSARGRAG